MTEWKPEEFAVGDRVVDSAHPDWGAGIITDALRMGDMELWDGRVLAYQKKSVGQRLSVRFDDGRTRTIISSSTSLKRAK